MNRKGAKAQRKRDEENRLNFPSRFLRAFAVDLVRHDQDYALFPLVAGQRHFGPGSVTVSLSIFCSP
jgi:hypothetical protein